MHDNKEWTVYARSGIIKKIILKFIILKSKFFFTVTEEQKKILKKIYPNKKIHISYNGISDHWFDNKARNRFTSNLQHKSGKKKSILRRLRFPRLSLGKSKYKGLQVKISLPF